MTRAIRFNPSAHNAALHALRGLLVLASGWMRRMIRSTSSSPISVAPEGAAIADRIEAEFPGQQAHRPGQLALHSAKRVRRHFHGVGDACVIERHPASVQERREFRLDRLIRLQDDESDPGPLARTGVSLKLQ